MQAEADVFFSKGRARSMLRSYLSGIGRYENFCQKMSCCPLPVSENILAAFVASLAKDMSYSSMNVYLSALRFYQISNNSGDPGIAGMARLEYILKGIRRDGVISSATHRRERLPVTPILLHEDDFLCQEGKIRLR